MLTTTPTPAARPQLSLAVAQEIAHRADQAASAAYTAWLIRDEISREEFEAQKDRQFRVVRALARRGFRVHLIPGSWTTHVSLPDADFN